MAMQIVFFGSSPFSTIVLNRILLAKRDRTIDTEHRISAVITTPDKPVGRHLKLTPNPVKVLAQKNNIPVYTLPSIPPLIQGGEASAGGSIGLVAAYGKIIPQETLDKFNGRIYNIHPSLLPKYRGPSPLQQQILDGVIDTGVTIIQLDALMDHGPIVAQEKDEILPDDTWITLGNRLFTKGAEIFLKLEPRTYNLKPQNHTLSTYTNKLTRQDGFLPWDEFNKLITDPTQNRHDPRLFRAYFPWPGVWSIDPHGQRRKLISLSPLLIR